MDIGGFVIVALVMAGLILVTRVLPALRKRAGQRSATNGFAEKSEAMFRSMFPDLQLHFHPAKLVDYVVARRGRAPQSGGFTWKNPPGFAADTADIQPEGSGERVRLLDAAGVLLADFLFEEHAEGGLLRVGKGKFTVNIRQASPRVRYWHPDREFKWTRDKWTFQSRLAEEPIDSSDRGTSWSSDSSSSSARGTAAAAGIVAAGGAFDGGGASGGWDDGGRSQASGGDGSSAGGASSDSSSSTSY